MAAITGLAETFETGANGVALSTANSAADNISGAGTGVFTTSTAYLGTKSLNVTTSAQSYTARFDHALAGGWRGIALRIVTPDLANLALLNWYAGATKGGDIQVTPDRRLKLRHVNTEIYTSPVLTANTWYYVTVRLSTNFRMRIYQAGVLLHDSGDTGVTPSVASLDNFRLGCLSSSTANVQFDYLQGDDASEPSTGITASTANAVYVERRVREIDTTGSTGTMTLTQTSGTAATITGPTSGVFKITLPTSYSEDLVFTLTATDAGTTDTETVTIPPQTSSVSEPLVYDGTTYR